MAANDFQRTELIGLRRSVPAVLVLVACVLWPSLLHAQRLTEDDPRVQRAIRQGVAYLREQLKLSANASGPVSLAALALVKSGQPVDDPLILRVVRAIQRQVKGTQYNPPGNHFYSAGVHLMLLEAIDAERYRPEMEAITRYILNGQLNNGSWYYPAQTGDGDTSITQYALLGLWMAARAEIEVPKSVWDDAAGWHIRYQQSDGGFAYHPPAGASRTTLTAAGIGSLYIARLHLYPDGKPISIAQRQKPKKPRRKYRFLEPVDLDDPEDSPGSASKAGRNGTVQTRLSAIDLAIGRAMQRLAARWSVRGDGDYVYYYLYALERMAALGEIQMVGTHDWYTEAAAFLIAQQQPDGSWRGNQSATVDTSFAVMCLGRATAKMLGQDTPGLGVGAGLLAGGRGLPDDLSQVAVEGGQVKTRKLLGPLDELLAELEKPKANRLQSAQQAIVERIQVGSREELIGNIPRLIKLVKDPRPEVRRTALWALGRSDDLAHLPLLINALKDKDVGVMVEAHNALCTLSRRPLAFGLPGHPLEGLPEDASQAEKDAAVARWRSQAIKRWRAWYLAVRPYQQRDDLAEPPAGGSREAR